MTYNNATDSTLNCIYSVCIALWTTFFVESWKRKQNWLANRWLVRNLEDQSFTRREFKASWSVDAELRKEWKVFRPNYWGLLVGNPISVIFSVIVIGVYIGMQYWQFKYNNVVTEKV